jgi:ABC-2 type transport system ATP-binding protein
MSADPQTIPDTGGDHVIETSGLTRYFGSRKAVDSLTMVVPRGCVFAFLGRNGSGKTTTIRMLLGLTTPTRGSSRLFGHDSQHLPPAVRARVGYVSESHSLNDWMTVRQNGTYQAQFYPRWNERIFQSIVDHFRLDPRATAATLSRGERAGLSLAITLAPEPELLILDDPALGLDPVARRSLLESMIYVTRGSDRTILFSSHLLDDVERVADYIGVLDRSVLRACCPVETFRAGVRQFVLHYPGTSQPPALPELRGLLNARRVGSELRLTIAKPDDATQSVLRSLTADSIEERPIGFADALVGYLGDRGALGSFLDDTMGQDGSRRAE